MRIMPWSLLLLMIMREILLLAIMDFSTFDSRDIVLNGVTQIVCRVLHGSSQGWLVLISPLRIGNLLVLSPSQSHNHRTLPHAAVTPNLTPPMQPASAA